MQKLLAILLPCALLACSLFSQPESDDDGPLMSTTGGIPPKSTTGAISPPAHSAPAHYNGPDSIEELILSSTAVIRARLTNTTTETVTTTADEHYYTALKFQFSVSEYLYGSGADSITAYFIGNSQFNTAQEAEAFAPTSASMRDPQFDNRDAVLFLTDGTKSEIFTALAEPQDVYILAVGGPPGHTRYWIDDRYERRWLPAASATAATSANQKFLLEQPAAGTTPSTTTLGALKAKVAAIVAEINAGDGSTAYKKCLQGKYSQIRTDEWHKSINQKPPSYEPLWDRTFASGQPAGTEVYNYKGRGSTIMVDGAEEKSRVWIDGEDGGLFSVNEANHYPFKDNWTLFDFLVVSTRPIPAGTYHFNHNYGTHIDCGNTTTFELTANVSAPEGTLHELFFDPVTVGNAVSADGTNGVLKPTSFTDAKGASATLSSISYESSTVKVEVTPDGALDGHVVDVIELDGTVSLSLDVFDATVDSVNDTLNWTVSEQPWDDGDLLMVRIREAPPSCRSNSVVLNADSEPALVGDCEALFALKDALAGTGTLNWGLDRAITSWDGVTVGGTPKRVTELDLNRRDLTGVVPAGLGDLTGLERIALRRNRLTGEIPPRLGELAELRHLDLSFNPLSGSMPPELGSLSVLRELFLYDTPNLGGEIPSELGNLSKLERLGLSGNALTGTIPAELGGLSRLRYLNLHENRLSGQIPTELGGLTGIQGLTLNSNELSGAGAVGAGRARESHQSDPVRQRSGRLPPSVAADHRVQRLYRVGTAVLRAGRSRACAWEPETSVLRTERSRSLGAL